MTTESTPAGRFDPDIDYRDVCEAAERAFKRYWAARNGFDVPSEVLDVFLQRMREELRNTCTKVQRERAPKPERASFPPAETGDWPTLEECVAEAHQAEIETPNRDMRSEIIHDAKRNKTLAWTYGRERGINAVRLLCLSARYKRYEGELREIREELGLYKHEFVIDEIRRLLAQQPTTAFVEAADVLRAQYLEFDRYVENSPTNRMLAAYDKARAAITKDGGK